jgi:hypothetical protein
MLIRRFLGAFALCVSLLASVSATASDYLQCVPFARAESGVEIRGNAKTWWSQAAGTYDRGNEPRKGAVMAFREPAACRSATSPSSRRSSATAKS